MAIYRKENGNLVDKSNLDASTISDIKQSLNNLKPKVLWTNPNPNIAFGAQTITLNSNEYDYYEVIYFLAYNNQYSQSNKARKGFSNLLNGVSPTTSNNVIVRSRTVGYTSETSLSIGDCYTQTNGSARSVDNASLVPYQVLGYKL